MATKPYLPGLNALRVYAALCVVIGHALRGVTLPPVEQDIQFWLGFVIMGGFDAVTLFFVLSGFLITWLMLHERRKHGTIDVRRFYARRALRILPLYFLIVCVSAVMAQPYVPYQPHVWAAIVLLSPHLFSWELGILGHLWSIGVEEWFYLFYPPLVKWLPLGAVIAAIIALRLVLIALVPDLLAVESKYTSGWMYFLRGIHFESMAIGAGGAWLLFTRHALLRVIYRLQILWWIVFIFIIVLPVDGGALYDLVLACIFLALILNVTGNTRPLVRLESAFWQRMGDASYAIYMWHMLVILMMERLTATFAWSDTVYVTGCVLGTIVVALLSYHFIERPILRFKPYTPERVTYPASGT